MKIKSYKQVLEREGFDDIDTAYDPKDDFLFSKSRNQYGSKYEDDEDFEQKKDDGIDYENDDDVQHLLYLLREMFKNVGVSVDVEATSDDISITAFLNRRGKLSDVIKIFEVVKKLKKDILGQYDSQFELWETKKGDPRITFEFSLEGEDGDTTPW